MLKKSLAFSQLILIILAIVLLLVGIVIITNLGNIAKQGVSPLNATINEGIKKLK